MLPDEDVAKLCQGRIIRANFYQSSGRDAAGPHWAVILDSDEQIHETDDYYVAVISSNNTIET
jgi:mRNA-degrading endonuclease toxin of MazEF toxin-antitoxin module